MWNPRIWCGKNPRKLRKIQLQQHFEGKLPRRTDINRDDPHSENRYQRFIQINRAFNRMKNPTLVGKTKVVGIILLIFEQ